MAEGRGRGFVGAGLGKRIFPQKLEIFQERAGPFVWPEQSRRAGKKAMNISPLRLTASAPCDGDRPNMADGRVLARVRTGSSGLRGAISICEALCHSPHLLLTAARPPNESAGVYTSAAVCWAQHKQGTRRTEGSSEDTKYARATWMIERSPPASRFWRRRARPRRVRALYLLAIA